MLVEVQVVIGTVHTVLVEADSVGAAEDVVMQWDPNGDHPAGFVAVDSEAGRATTSVVEVCADCLVTAPDACENCAKYLTRATDAD